MRMMMVPKGWKPSERCPRCHRKVGTFKNGKLRPHKTIVDTGRRWTGPIKIGASSIAFGDWCVETKEQA